MHSAPFQFGCGFAVGAVVTLIGAWLWFDFESNWTLTLVALAGALAFGWAAARHGDAAWERVSRWIRMAS